MHETTKNNKFYRAKLLYILLGAAILLSSCLAIKTILEWPRDLGPKLQYIGRDDHICLTFPLCDGPFYRVNFYFATTMNEQEIKGYFKKATYSSTDYAEDDAYGYKTYNYAFRGEGGTLYYYTEESFRRARPSVSSSVQSNKPHIIEIDDRSYAVLKQAL